MGRNKLPENELKKHETFRATKETIAFLKKLGGSKQKGFDKLIKKAKREELFREKAKKVDKLLGKISQKYQRLIDKEDWDRKYKKK